jgi:hypothetical protein
LPSPGCDGDDPAGSGDSTPPTAVTDLRVATVTERTVTLAWTAPGDDGDEGTASAYDVRYDEVPVTAGSWASCTQAATEPDPAVAGTEQTLAIDTGADGQFHFALKAADEVPNWSGLSNVVTATVAGEGFTIHQLTSSDSNRYPCLDDGFVVWIKSDGEGDEVYIANIGGAASSPTRLTDNGGEKAHPNNHGSERIVWQGREGPASDWEIWVYDKLGVPRFRALTDNTVPDLGPDLAGAGDFAWLHGHTMYGEIHWWNESTHEETVISDGCCPASEWSNEIPSTDEGAVLWLSYHRSTGGEQRTFLWDGGLTDLTDVFLAINYSLDAGRIAYEYATHPSFIRYWDTTAVHEIGEGYRPSLSGEAIAYESWDGHDWEIRYWDGTTIHDVTDNDFDDSEATLNGSLLAWVGRPTGSGGLYQVFYTNLQR